MAETRKQRVSEALDAVLLGSARTGDPWHGPKFRGEFLREHRALEQRWQLLDAEEAQTVAGEGPAAGMAHLLRTVVLHFARAFEGDIAEQVGSLRAQVNELKNDMSALRAQVASAASSNTEFDEELTRIESKLRAGDEPAEPADFDYRWASEELG